MEWCDTPIARKPGFSTTDGCWAFADPDGSLQSVAPHPRNDIYLAVPHAASDPVLESHKRRVIDFLRTTFFDNAIALECQLAAMCLTLRGMNNVRAFMTLGPGGVGQSLNTTLVANVFGDMHDFVDMNVFYTEDELRKQADTFTGKVVMTDQETPNTDKPRREDLYKKVMSGDPPCYSDEDGDLREVETLRNELLKKQKNQEFKNLNKTKNNKIKKKNFGGGAAFFFFWLRCPLFFLTVAPFTFRCGVSFFFFGCGASFFLGCGAPSLSLFFKFWRLFFCGLWRSFLFFLVAAKKNNKKKQNFSKKKSTK